MSKTSKIEKILTLPNASIDCAVGYRLILSVKSDEVPVINFVFSTDLLADSLLQPLKETPRLSIFAQKSLKIMGLITPHGSRPDLIKTELLLSASRRLPVSTQPHKNPSVLALVTNILVLLRAKQFSLVKGGMTVPVSLEIPLFLNI